MAKSEISQADSEEFIAQEPRPKVPGTVPAPVRAFIGVVLAAGVVAGYRYVSDEGRAVSYSGRSTTDLSAYNLIGVAAGGRWKNHFAFSSEIQGVLEQVDDPYAAWPSDNPILDFKSRVAKRPDFTDNSILLEVGDAQLRLEGITTIHPVPKDLQGHSTDN